MSSIPQNHFDENDLIDCVQRFFSKHHVGKLLARCNGMKEKGVSLFRKVFLMYSSDLKLYIIHIYIIFIHFRSCPVKNCLC